MSIETKTESRPAGEAKEQLGVWIAAQIARIELLLDQIAPAVDVTPVSPQEAPSKQSAAAPMAQTSDAGPSSAFSVLPPPPSLLCDMAFPLIQIQADDWKLFFARVSPHRAANPLTLPHAHIEIFGTMRLGDTSSVFGTYRLLKSLRVLKSWINEEYRSWWDRILREMEGDEEE